MGLPSKYVTGFSFATFVVDQKYYMQYLTNKLKDSKVKFLQRRVEDVKDLTAQYDIVINCTGLGAKQTNSDDGMYPIRGQVLRVRSPWMNNVWFFGTSYIIPNVDNVVLGGTAQKGDWSTQVSLADTDKILGDIYQLFPSMKNAPLVK